MTTPTQDLIAGLEPCEVAELTALVERLNSGPAFVAEGPRAILMAGRRIGELLPRLLRSIRPDRPGGEGEEDGASVDESAARGTTAPRPDSQHSAGWRLVPEVPTREMLEAAIGRSAAEDESMYSAIYRAMLAAAPAPRAPELIDVAGAWQDLLDKDDRTSPAEYPEMALITREELADCMASASPTPDRQEPVQGALGLAVRILDINLGGATATFDEMGLSAVRSAWETVKAALMAAQHSPAEPAARSSSDGADLDPNQSGRVKELEAAPDPAIFDVVGETRDDVIAENLPLDRARLIAEAPADFAEKVRRAGEATSETSRLLHLKALASEANSLLRKVKGEEG